MTEQDSEEDLEVEEQTSPHEETHHEEITVVDRSSQTLQEVEERTGQ